MVRTFAAIFDNRKKRHLHVPLPQYSEASINAMNRIFPGFGPWYRTTYTWQQRLDAAEASAQREVSA